MATWMKVDTEELDSKLVAIGDALRGKVGETEIIYDYVPMSHIIEDQHTADKSGNSGDVEAITINGASKIKVSIEYCVGEATPSSTCYYDIHLSNKSFNTLFGKPTPQTLEWDGQTHTIEVEFDGTNTVYYYLRYNSVNANSKITFTGYDADGNIIMNPEAESMEVKKTFSMDEMAETIEAMDDPLPEEALNITGDCQYKFINNNWNWVIDTYGNRITTEDIKHMGSMFANSNKLQSIPFDINITNNANNINMNQMFNGCKKLRTLPRFKGDITSYAVGIDMTAMFRDCYELQEIPDDYFTGFGGEDFWTASITKNCYRQQLFYGCYSLRKLPDLNCLKSVTSSYYCLSNSTFRDCYSLDEVINFPVLTFANTVSSNTFSDTFMNCARLKNFTFALNGSKPYEVEWKSQTLDLSNNIGYIDYGYDSYIINYNSGITTDKEVKDNATYQALKNDPDWWTHNINYARYNHDSAVETINSLPDTSAYLATAGGTNTIKFEGASGSLTDGGAINTLTEEEIAVATAKGWTVSLV